MKILKALFVVIVLCAGCKQSPVVLKAPVLNNIGDYNVPVTTESEYSQQFFNQGIIMANNFNHEEAVRSFREAVRLDSTFAMGYWGIAYALGPNFNSTDNMGTVDQIRKAVSKAAEFSEHVSPWEQAVIKAIQIKFPTDTTATNGEGFSTSMKEAFNHFPDHSFVATLYAESVMNIHPWDFYEGKGGAPKPWTTELVTLLEKVITIDPKNPLANHLYLHATEASADLSKSLEVAERLKTLVPSAGHLVHMPSHIYINTGDYHAASVANEEAVISDSTYIAECQAQGYYPQMYYTHNYHFLAATTAFEGRGAHAIEAAYKTTAIIDKKYYFESGYETVQHYLTIPNHVLVKFAQWEKILLLPQPEKELSYPTAIWHYARGMAFSNLNKKDQAQEELKILKELISKDSVIAHQMIWGINKVSEVCQISSLVLEAAILEKEGKDKVAVQLLTKAIQMEDNLNYNEPPDWFFSVRHSLGNVLLKTGDYVQAEKVYQEDLKRWPKNGFALNGLIESYKGQKKLNEAEGIKKQFDEAWKLADTELKGSVVDADKRKNLTLKVSKAESTALVYLAGAICMDR